MVVLGLGFAVFNRVLGLGFPVDGFTACGVGPSLFSGLGFFILT